MEKKRPDNSKFIEHLNYAPHPHDMSCFQVIAEFVDGENVFEDFPDKENLYYIYAIQMGDHLYVGSSAELRKRIYAHNNMARAGKHQSLRFQTVYNWANGFKAYLLMKCKSFIGREHEYAEQLMIRTLQPSLNDALPRGKYLVDSVWSMETKPKEE